MLSVGEVTEGKRSYVVRTESVNYTPDTAKKIVIRSKISPNGTIVPILLDDLATVEMRVKKRTSFRRMNGKPAVTFSVLREQGSNVVATMTRLSSVVTSLNKNELANKGLSLSIVYDETNYIRSNSVGQK